MASLVPLVPQGSASSQIPVSAYPPEITLEHRPVALIGLDFRFQHANVRFQREVGVSLADLRGAALSDLWAFELGHDSSELIEHLAAMGVFVIEAVAASARPTTPAATLQLMSLEGDSGRHLGFTVTAVTDEARREKRQRSLDAEGLQLAFEQVSVGMMMTGVDGFVIKCNPAMERLVGRSFAEIAQSDLITMIHPDFRASAITQGLRLLTGEIDSYSQETQLVDADGSPVWVFETAACVRDEDGSPLHFVTQFVDIRDRKQAEAERNRALEELSESQAKIKFLFDGTPVPLVEIDSSLTICAANAALAQLLGRDPLGLNITDLLHPKDFRAIAEEGATVEPNTDWIMEIRVRRYDGTERLVRSHGRIHHDDQGMFRSATATWHDITDARHEEERLRVEASTDPLTGLAHRATFLRSLQLAIDAAPGHDSLAVLFIDLDNFKPVNDEHGHDAGDQLLCQVARRLTTCVRSGDLVARLGGDEFVVMIDVSDAVTDPTAIGSRIVARIAQPFTTNYGMLGISASVGLAVGGAGSDPRDLVHRADLAAYQAKADGRSRLVVASATC